MANPLLYALGSVFAVSLVAFVGIFTLSLKQDKLKKVLIYFVSFAAGGLIGDAFIHLLPELVELTGGFGLSLSMYIITGIAFSFTVEKVVHWHHYHTHEEEELHPVIYINLIGDGIHNFVDGLTIAVSYIVSVPVGIATTLAVFAHEIPQEIGDFAVLVHGGFNAKKALFMNFITALMSVIGAVFAFALYSYAENFLPFLLAFAAGNFIYIASSDLIPELHKETHTIRSFLQLIAFGLGIGIILSLLLLE